MLDSKFVEFVESNDSEGETYVTFVEVTDGNREVLEQLIALSEKAVFAYDSVVIREADSRIDNDVVELLSLYDTNGYAPGFVVSELDGSVASQVDELALIDDNEALGDELVDAFRIRSGFTCTS